MAIIAYPPSGSYRLGYNDNVWVIRTTQPTETKRFEVAIADANTFAVLARLRVYPIAHANQTGTPDRAYVDLSRILQSQLGSDVAIPTTNQTAFYTNPKSHFEYVIVVKEEDVDMTTGAYETIPSGWYLSSKGKSVWNGVQNLSDWQDFDPDDYLMTTGAATTKFLTDGPSTREIEANQSAFLYLIATENNAPVHYQLRTYDGYDGTGSVINNTNITNPFATLINGGFTSRYLRMPVGTYDIPLINAAQFSSGSPATILNGAKSYTITLQDNVGFGQVISETVTFNIGKNCTKYNPIRLHWLGRLGGYESFNFTQKSKETTKIDRKQYRQEYHTWEGTGWNYTKASRGLTDYNTETENLITVNTPYLNEAESLWMESLISSPQVFQEVGNELISVNVDERKVERKTSLNDKLMQYTFKLKYSLKNHRQRG